MDQYKRKDHPDGRKVTIVIKRSFILILCIVLLTGGSAVAEYEQQIRTELNDKMGMPLSAEKDYEEDLYGVYCRLP